MPMVKDYYVIAKSDTLVVTMTDGVILEVPMSVGRECTDSRQFQEKMEKIYADKIGGHANVT